jgi:hypothetical protein
MKIFLDSGAFSAWNSGKKIDLNSYIRLCKKYQDEVDVIASLDVVPGNRTTKLNSKEQQKEVQRAAEEGYENYDRMLQAGISHKKLIHTFHQFDPPEFLERMIEDEIEYIGISPSNSVPTAQRMEWLDKVCMPLLLDKNNNPKVKFHGFAVTSLRLVLNYPWTSVDSSSWVLRANGFGLIDLPSTAPPKTKEHHYVTSVPVSKGVKGFGSKKEGGLFETEPVSQLEATINKNKSYFDGIKKYMKSFGFDFDEVVNSNELRPVWNAVYLMYCIDKFYDTDLYLASGSFKSVSDLVTEMNNRNLDHEVNVLTSYAALPKKNKNKSILDKLIELKHEIK